MYRMFSDVGIGGTYGKNTSQDDSIDKISTADAYNNYLHLLIQVPKNNSSLLVLEGIYANQSGIDGIYSKNINTNNMS